MATWPCIVWVKAQLSAASYVYPAGRLICPVPFMLPSFTTEHTTDTSCIPCTLFVILLAAQGDSSVFVQHYGTVACELITPRCCICCKCHCMALGRGMPGLWGCPAVHVWFACACVVCLHPHMRELHDASWLVISCWPRAPGPECRSAKWTMPMYIICMGSNCSAHGCVHADMAPEVIARHELAPAADVYSFGVLLWSMFTGKRPWEGLTHARIVHELVLQHGQLQFPEGERGGAKEGGVSSTAGGAGPGMSGGAAAQVAESFKVRGILLYSMTISTSST